MDNNGQQWATMDNNGQQWTTVGNNGQQWTTMGNNGQQWTTTGNNGQQWTTIRGATCIFVAVFTENWAGPLSASGDLPLFNGCGLRLSFLPGSEYHLQIDDNFNISAQ